MAQTKSMKAETKTIVGAPAKTDVFNPGDLMPPIVDLENVPKGSPVFSGTDVPLEYLFKYVDEAHNLYAFLDAFPQVSMKQALAAIRVRVAENNLIFSDKNYVNGTPIFRGTRVPIDILFEFLAAGENIDEFLEGFPSVSREQAVEALMLARYALESIAYESAN